MANPLAFEPAFTELYKDKLMGDGTIKPDRRVMLGLAAGKEIEFATQLDALEQSMPMIDEPFENLESWWETWGPTAVSNDDRA